MTFQNEGEMKTFTDKPRLGGSSKTMTLITKKKKMYLRGSCAAYTTTHIHTKKHGLSVT
jgi:hypothetical protein